MEKNFTTRTGLIIGEDGIEKLKNSNVIVFGVGGVGSFPKIFPFSFRFVDWIA